MARRVFYSFHFDNDNWRANQVRNMGVVEGNQEATGNEWEEVKKGGDRAIQKWINDNLDRRTCTIVLIGSKTANRKWINYEIEKSWNDGKGILGINIHNLKGNNSEQDTKGANPFDYVSIDKKKLSSIVKVYDPPFKTSTYVYANIRDNIAEWIEKAIEIRNNY